MKTTFIAGVPRLSSAGLNGAVHADGAGNALGIPINDEGVHGKAFTGLRLPPVVGASRADQVNAEVALALHQQPGTEVAGVNDMLRRQKALVL